MTDLSSIAAREAAAKHWVPWCSFTGHASSEQRNGPCVCVDCVKWQLMADRAFLLGEVSRLTAAKAEAIREAVEGMSYETIDNFEAAVERSSATYTDFRAALLAALEKQ